jgi:hypothetical protein
LIVRYFLVLTAPTGNESPYLGGHYMDKPASISRLVVDLAIKFDVGGDLRYTSVRCPKACCILPRRLREAHGS